MTDKTKEVFIPRGTDRNDPGLYVSVNGEAYLLPRGKTSRVPGHIAAEIDRALAAEERLHAEAKRMRNEE